MGEVRANDRSIPGVSEVDAYLPDHQFAIEYNGVYWHSEPLKKPGAHYDKWHACLQQGIRLLQIWEDEWMADPDLVKCLIASKLGVDQGSAAYARNTSVRSISAVSARDFLCLHHIHGRAGGSMRLGLSDGDDLVACAVFEKSSGTEGAWELVRYASAFPLVGGLEKLIKIFQEQCDPSQIITYVDHSVPDDDLYINLGFTAEEVLAPDYKYVIANRRESKFNYRLKRFQDDDELQYQQGLTARELADLNGLSRIWDAGKTRYVIKRR